MVEVLTVADVLERAADLIEPEGAWTQGVWFGDDKACMCAEGALYRVTGSDPVFGHPVSDKAIDYFGTLQGNSIADWNDAPGRTQAEVVAKLREAAALARAQQETAK